MGESVFQTWVTIKKQIPANSTMVVDSIPLSDFITLEYLVAYFGDNKTLGLNMSARKTDTDVVNQVYSKNGDALTIGIDTEINVDVCETKVTNGEAFAVDLVLKRTKL